MRWVFIRPHNHSPYYDPEIQEPLGLEYLTASRKDKGDHVLLLDAVLDSMDEIKTARRAVSYMPDAVGFSIMTGQEIDSVLKIYKECRRVLENNNICWLAGGNFISYEIDQALLLLPDDFILVRFEGENALEQLASSWLKTIDKDAKKSEPPQRIVSVQNVHDIDTLPFPHRPFAEQILGMERAFNLQGSRGCCGTCKYCPTSGERTLRANRWRGRSMENIVSEIAELNYHYGARSFNFIDEDFLGPNKLSLERAHRFKEEITDRKLNISFSIQVRPDSLSNEIIDLLSSIGLCYVFLGIESDDPQDFKTWGRLWTHDPWRFIKCLRKYNIDVGAGVLLFHPDSSFQGIRRFASTLQKNELLNHRTAVNRMDAIPGSIIHKEAIHSGYLERKMGSQLLPFKDKRIDYLYNDLVKALSPIGPPSMQAICSLPPLIAKSRYDPSFVNQYRQLKIIVKDIDNAVAKSFFSLLDHHEKGTVDSKLVNNELYSNFEVALKAANELAKHGFVFSFDILREAIRIDSGL